MGLIWETTNIYKVLKGKAQGSRPTCDYDLNWREVHENGSSINSRPV